MNRVLHQPARLAPSMRASHVSGLALAALVLTLLLVLTAQIARATPAAAASALSDGDLVVYRVGTGSGSLVNTGNPVSLDEFTPTGTLVQSLALPTAASGANQPLIASGTATSEGLLTRSMDGHYLLASGYATPPGGSVNLSSTSASTVRRVIGRVDGCGTIDTSTALTDWASSNTPRSVASATGSDFWVGGGAGGVRYVAGLGASTSTDLSSSSLSNVRQLNIFLGQLYASSASGSTLNGVDVVGSGLPTIGPQIVTRLTAGAGSSAFGFFFADLDAGVAGPDTLYVADDGAGALSKFSLVSGNWVANGTIGSRSDSYRGLTGSVSGSNVTLFATRNGGQGPAGGGQIVTLVDGSGYNAALTGTPTVIATAANNTAFRGVAFAPTGACTTAGPTITTQPGGSTVASGGSPTLSVGATGTPPVSYQWFQGTASDTSHPIASATGPSITTPALSATTSYWVRVSDANGSFDSQTATIDVGAPLRIHDIQGAAHISPHVGETVGDVSGIVTALRSNGFYLQDPQPDDNPATSEGIFVFTSSAPKVAVGDALQVGGKVAEFRSGEATSTNLTTTEIDFPSITTISNNNPLPDPVVLGTGGRLPPTTVIEDDATGNVENSGVFDPDSDGIDFYESLEGMRVQVNNAVVVGPTQVFGSGGSKNSEIDVLGDSGSNASVRTMRGGILARADDFNPERIIFNDLISAGPRLPAAIVSDTFPGATVGVLDYSFGNYKLEVTSLPPAVSGGLMRTIAATPGPDELTVAGFNVENLSPNDPPAKFATLASLIVENLGAPDLISVEEIQDNNGATDNGVVDATTTYTHLIDAISAASPEHVQYAFRQVDPVNDQDGGQPGGNIRQGFLFRTDRGLAFVDRGQATSLTPTTIVTTDGEAHLSVSPGRVDPTSAAWKASRKPLAGEFTYNGNTLFVIANHLIAKLGDDPLFGRDQPPLEVTKRERLQQAQVLHDFVSSILSVDPSANVVVLGDLNDFQFSDPLLVLTGSANNGSPVLTDLVNNLPEDQRYSYDFQGNSETLDHILTSANLTDRSVLEPIHVNAEFADQASDHDPMLARIHLPDMTPP